MEQFKKAKVVMLPTNEAKGDFSKERIYPCLLKYSWMFDKEEKGKLIFADSNIKTPTQLQNLYIISDDKIKEGDWVYENNLNQETQIYQVYDRNNELGFFRFRNVFVELSKSNCKKIIATTDSSLTLTGLQSRSSKDFSILSLPQPSQQFIEKYIEEYNKGNVITDVLVEYESDFNSCFCTKDICNGNNCPKKLKVNPKDNTITIKIVKDCYTREEVVKLLVDCCGEVSCEDGKLLGKNPEELYKWIEENL